MTSDANRFEPNPSLSQPPAGILVERILTSSSATFQKPYPAGQPQPGTDVATERGLPRIYSERSMEVTFTNTQGSGGISFYLLHFWPADHNTRLRARHLFLRSSRSIYFAINSYFFIANTGTAPFSIICRPATQPSCNDPDFARVSDEIAMLNAANPQGPRRHAQAYTYRPITVPPNKFSPVTFHQRGHKVTYKARLPGGGELPANTFIENISYREYDATTAGHPEIGECRISVRNYHAIYRPAWTYINVMNGNTNLTIDGDKDGDGPS